jgi:hypothetical protein
MHNKLSSLIMLALSLSGCFCKSKETMPISKDSQRKSVWLQQVPEQLQSHTAFDYVRDKLNLPRVLLIGDSISIGYTPGVRQLLKDKANIHRAPTNCGPTASSLVNIKKWLKPGNWDIIHFNFGLHDMMYIDEKGQLSDQGRKVNSIEQYKQNIKQIAILLKASAPKVIFATTTPVTEGTTGFVISDPAEYNAAVLLKNSNLLISKDLCRIAFSFIIAISL